MNAMLKPIEIVKVEDGEPMTSTLQIALGLGIQHATIIKLVRTYMPDFQEFGLVRFKIQPRLEGQHGGGDVKFVPLNEQQATFLMTLMRNSPRVIEFKKALVKAFLKHVNLSDHKTKVITIFTTNYLYSLILRKPMPVLLAAFLEVIARKETF